MKKYCIAVAFTLLLNSPVIFSQSDPIIVTATRTAQTANETLASVTIVTREDIEELQATSVQDLLRTVPGINITNSGGAGKTTSIFMRGTQSDHVLVLIDGVKVGSATLGTTAFQHIPVEQIERIEIVRGPRSSLFGSEAIGGVIQIFTRKADGETRPYFSLGVGSFETTNLSAGVSGNGGRSWYSVNATGIDSEGFNACNGSTAPFAGCFTIEPDKDGYENQSISFRAGYRFENDLELEVQALRADGETEFDGSFQNSSESIQQIVGSTLRFSPNDIWHLKLAAGNSVDDSDNFIDGVFASRFKTERTTFSWQNDLRISPMQLLSLGADYQDDEIDSDTPYPVTSRDNVGLFVQYQTDYSGHDLQFSARTDDNERSGNSNTGGFGWGTDLNQNLRITASYASAFKVPTFNELYFPFFGNENLDPEESRSFELGINGEADWGGWSLGAYETKIENLIAFDSSTFLAGNINDARIRGIEATLSTQLQSWNLDSNLTLLDARDRSDSDNRNNLLPRRAEESIRVDANRQFGRYKVGFTLIAVGERYNDLANETLLDSYTTVDLRLEYQLAKQWLLQARTENLFDEDYETAELFNQPEQSFFITLRYRP